MRLLGDHSIAKKLFPSLDSLFAKWRKEEFLSSSYKKRSDAVSRSLLELIQKEPLPCFLLAAVLDFMERVEKEKILDAYSFSNFELWLNSESGLDFEENYKVRAKIAGKWVERSDYQLFFPIGMGKIYEGTHFVTAHKSPDLDTTIASFWGWLDAFAARVSEGLHIWNLPGGPPSSQIEIQWLFSDLFGPSIFTHLAKERTALTVTGRDLMAHRRFQRRTPADSISHLEHEAEQTAIVVVDEEGFYLGDWRSLDVEGVHPVILLFSSCLRWFENHLHLQLISLMAKPSLSARDIPPFLAALFGLKVRDCEPAREFTAKQRKQVADFAIRVLRVKEGLSATFEELGVRLAQLSGVPFAGASDLFGAMQELFNDRGELLEERPRLFSFLAKAVRHLHEALFKIRSRLEQLDIALKAKTEVIGSPTHFATLRSDIEEIRNKMGSSPYLSVVVPDGEKLIPVGVIPASQLRKSILGTVSLRDFCNRDEMSIPPYLDVISVIDHHKSQLNTFSPPMAIIADAQASNSLVAERAFQLNDRYSLGGQKPEEIEEEIEKRSRALSPRLLQRLLQRRLAMQKGGLHFIHPDREFIEYLHFLYAILDDTDLLSKVSILDVECVASLLNRLKSLSLKREVEVISLDDLPRDREFAKKGTQRILQNEEMYSLYKKAYAYKEKQIEQQLSLSAKGEPANIFSDTKEQNGCCRIGQTKLFVSNVAYFEQHADRIRRVWLKEAQEVYEKKPEIDLYLHMISTVVSAEEVYSGVVGSYSHRDELWIWIPSTEGAREHLQQFLSAFQYSPGLKGSPLEVEFLGSNALELAKSFQESFSPTPQKISKKDLPLAILRFKAGALNSRKAMVSPFLPVTPS